MELLTGVLGGVWSRKVEVEGGVDFLESWFRGVCLTVIESSGLLERLIALSKGSKEVEMLVVVQKLRAIQVLASCCLTTHLLNLALPSLRSKLLP